MLPEDNVCSQESGYMILQTKRHVDFISNRKASANIDACKTVLIPIDGCWSQQTWSMLLSIDISMTMSFWVFLDISTDKHPIYLI